MEHARHVHLQDEFLQSKEFENVDCLALTLEEMVHIRHVLTKADLESLPLDTTNKDDIAGGKVPHSRTHQLFFSFFFIVNSNITHIVTYYILITYLLYLTHL